MTDLLFSFSPRSRYSYCTGCGIGEHARKLGGAQRLVSSFVCRDVAHAEPERHVRMPADDLSRVLEGAVNVAERAEMHVVIW